MILQVRFYDALAKALSKEHIKPEAEEDDPVDGTEVRFFLQNEPWLFLPSRRNKKEAFDNYNDAYEGEFLLASSVAFRDPSGLFGCHHVTEEMINLAAEAVRMQTVIGYYAYDTYKQQRYPEMRTICNFFEQWGVSDRIGLDAYVAVLRLIDHNVRAMDPDYLWEDDHVYHKVVCRIMVALKTGAHVVREELG